MNKDRKQIMKGYIAQLEDIADRAEKLQNLVDDEYRALLKTEVAGYRQLIAIWRKRIKDGN